MPDNPIATSAVASDLVLYAACMPAAPFRDYVSAAAGAGFDAVTIWPLMYRRALSREGLTAADMKQLVADAGLKFLDLDPIGSWLPNPDSGDDTSPGFRSVWTRQEFFDCAEALGLESLVAVHLGSGEVEPEVAIEGFAELCDDAAEHGLKVGLEFMPFSGIPDLDAALHIVETADRANGGYVFDLWHLHRSGGGRADLARLPLERVFCVQFSDGPVDAPADLLDEAMWNRLEPGTGSFDLAGDLRALAEAGLSTRVGPEAFRKGFSERDPHLVAKDLMAATRNVLGLDPLD